jgi:hypothetical protein
MEYLYRLIHEGHGFCCGLWTFGWRPWGNRRVRRGTPRDTCLQSGANQSDANLNELWGARVTHLL